MPNRSRPEGAGRAVERDSQGSTRGNAVTPVPINPSLKALSYLGGYPPALLAQVQGLIDSGVPGLHFYVLNKSPATVSVLRSVKR